MERHRWAIEADLHAQVYYWSTIRKLHPNYHACRGVQEELVCKILRDHVVCEQDAAKAHEKILQLPGLAKFRRALRTEDEAEHFERHLRKYINIYLPDCPFEVDTTNRYTRMTPEACIKARKAIRKGEPIKYLSGIQVEMTEREEKELSSRTDFSIVISSRRKRPSLFLGPARFANHDCDSNAKLNTNGPHGIHIVACKDISVGDEITVTYGDDYFGIDNRECLCATCEELARHGWDPHGPLLRDDSSDDEEADRKGAKSNGAPTWSIFSLQTTRLGKRKRGELSAKDSAAPVLPPKCGEVSATDPAAPVRRKRGRPRKYPIVEKGKELKRVDGHAMLKNKDAVQTSQGSEEGLKSGQKRNSNDATAVPASEGHKGSPSSGAESFTHIKTKTPSSYCTGVFKMLSSIADREDGISKPQSTRPQSRTGQGFRHERADSGGNTHSHQSSSKKAGLPAEKTAPPPHCANMSQNSSHDLIPKDPKTDSPASMYLKAAKSKLQSIRKEQSASQLRNVENAQHHGVDIYSVPDSPDPRPSKRKAAAAPTTLSREHDAKVIDSASLSSWNIDSASSITHLSSATSDETFSAGNIASSICQMLTTEDPSPPVDKPVSEKPVSDKPVSKRQTRGADAALPKQHESHIAAESTSAAAGHIASPICQMLTAQYPSPPVDKPVSNASSICQITTEGASTPVDNLASKRRKRLGADAALLNEHESTSPGPPESRHRGLRRGRHRASSATSARATHSIECTPPAPGKRGPVRTPGDYHLTRDLLTTPYHRWVACRNCEAHFVQSDAYHTRIACPRCERHSKLYGYHWPKTDREGPWDTQARVLDPRTIHRFLGAGEEKFERKGRRTVVEILREQEQSSRGSEETDGGDGSGGSGRGERKLRGATRKRAGRTTM